MLATKATQLRTLEIFWDVYTNTKRTDMTVEQEVFISAVRQIRGLQELTFGGSGLIETLPDRLRDALGTVVVKMGREKARLKWLKDFRAEEVPSLQYRKLAGNKDQFSNVRITQLALTMQQLKYKSNVSFILIHI
jgi:hypothetical protein